MSLLELGGSSGDEAANGQIKNISREVRAQRQQLHRAKKKRIGILPGELHSGDIKASFVMGNKAPAESKDEIDITDIQGNLRSIHKRPLADLVIIKQNNRYYMYWRTLNTLCCLTSSFFYAFMAAFRGMTGNPTLYKINMAYESVFLISMGLQFIVEYVEVGNPTPVRDL